MNNNSSANKIFVAGLNWKIDKQALGDFFSQFGAVKDAFVVLDRENENKSKGFGFVEFIDPIAQDIVEKTNGIDFEGRKIKVAVALPKKQ